MTGSIIVATGTAQRSAKRAVVRLSGEGCHQLVSSLSCIVKDQGRIKQVRLRAPLEAVPATVYFFKKGFSYTTEEMVEVHVVGNKFVVSTFIENCLQLGAREAQAGEFTRLAVKGGRLSLNQALAVMHLIVSRSQEEHKRALATLCHKNRDNLQQLQEKIHHSLIHIENELDFDDLDEGLLPTCFFEELFTLLQRSWTSLRSAKPTDNLPRVLLWGKANAGKSTLFNALGGKALTSQEAGTTRDWLSVELEYKGCRFILIDTPGYDGPEASFDVTSKRLAAEQKESADLQLTIGRLSEGSESVDWFSCADEFEGEVPLNSFSSLTGAGVNELKEWILQRLVESYPLHFFNEQHCQKIDACFEDLRNDVQSGLMEDAVVWSSHLRELARLLNPMGTSVHADDVLNDLFSNFCIGK